VSVRDELLAAIEAGDHQTVHRLGWGDVWEILATGWAPREVCSMNDLKPWVKMLGTEDPATLLEAIQENAGDWRPKPGQIRGYLNRTRSDNHRVDVGRGRDRSSTPEALSAVADAIRAGEEPCTCGPPTMRRWRPDANYVLRCPEGHLEQGQVYAAEDAGLIELAA
jgi:hypothetical protein